MTKQSKSELKLTDGQRPIVKSTERPRFLGKKFLTQAEVSERYGIPESTLENWRCVGKGPKHFKLEGSIVRYRLKNLVAWEKAAERNNTCDTGGDT